MTFPTLLVSFVASISTCRALKLGTNDPEQEAKSVFAPLTYEVPRISQTESFHDFEIRIPTSLDIEARNKHDGKKKFVHGVFQNERIGSSDDSVFVSCDLVTSSCKRNFGHTYPEPKIGLRFFVAMQNNDEAEGSIAKKKSHPNQIQKVFLQTKRWFARRFTPYPKQRIRHP